MVPSFLEGRVSLWRGHGCAVQQRAVKYYGALMRRQHTQCNRCRVALTGIIARLIRAAIDRRELRVALPDGGGGV